MYALPAHCSLLRSVASAIALGFFVLFYLIIWLSHSPFGPSTAHHTCQSPNAITFWETGPSLQRKQLYCPDYPFSGSVFHKLKEVFCPFSDDGGVSSEEVLSTGDGDPQDGQLGGEDRELKDKLLRKFGSHIGSLKLEFSKKKKRGKLPKDARQTLLQWWNNHYKWPYPTEGDKIALTKSTGLDQKQINNWFINQRKRHWKPSENMPFSMMDGLTGQFITDE